MNEILISSKTANLKDYLSLARIDHWFKNVFMLPGVLFAFIYFKPTIDIYLFINFVVGVLSTCFIASANYVINEWIDAEFDQFHPVKKHRSSVAKDLNKNIVLGEYALFAIAGLLLAYSISIPFFLTELLLIVMGFLYNVKPFRTKDLPYLDVISESVNNPIRFLLGWFIIVPLTFPPASILVAYWMAGAFLMATKRFAEYNFIEDKTTAGLYRKSFIHYNYEKLLISLFFYALTSTFFLGIFLIKHRIELIITFPFFALLFAWYLKIGFNKNSIVQKPEKLYKKKRFMLYILFLSLLFTLLLIFDIEPLHWFLLQNFDY